MSLAVLAQRLVLPVLVKRGFEIAAALVAGKAEGLRRLCLLNRERDELEVGFQVGEAAKTSAPRPWFAGP